MATSSAPQFKPPPVVECLSWNLCFGFGKKVYNPTNICTQCLLRYDAQQLRLMANGNTNALAVIEEELPRRQTLKSNLEAHGRFLCAFEDPDFAECRWRHQDLNLRGTRLNCSVVKRKGMACEKCWGRRLQKFAIMQHFTPTGTCHEEVDRIVPQTGNEESVDHGDDGNDDDDDDDDVEGYNTILS